MRPGVICIIVIASFAFAYSYTGYTQAVVFWGIIFSGAIYVLLEPKK
jgi:hypothetical protein